MTDALLNAGFPPDLASADACAIIESVSATWLTTPGSTHPPATLRPQIESAAEPVNPHAPPDPARSQVTPKVALLVAGLETRLTAQDDADSDVTHDAAAPPVRHAQPRSTAHRPQVHSFGPDQRRGCEPATRSATR